ncbi:hypothetical protein [Mixta intestinalis]|uniref:Uncharacterized protein n=1 Tax=Mixta intestinalis TaxID=1615494 RepID=A0A6P1Q4K9_9GAMM|nr:hypothetical protein [Mixta intestinalis]QHM73341.1 hypothetical protein C7M51_03688 [Mixta intestinalis]
MTKKRCLIIGGAIVIMMILVIGMGEGYGNEARSFLNALRKII